MSRASTTRELSSPNPATAQSAEKIRNQIGAWRQYPLCCIELLFFLYMSITKNTRAIYVPRVRVIILVGCGCEYCGEALPCKGNKYRHRRKSPQWYYSGSKSANTVAMGSRATQAVWPGEKCAVKPSYNAAITPANSIQIWLSVYDGLSTEST